MSPKSQNSDTFSGRVAEENMSITRERTPSVLVAITFGVGIQQLDRHRVESTVRK